MEDFEGFEDFKSNTKLSGVNQRTTAWREAKPICEKIIEKLL
jgi:hypothetical protein